MPDDVFLSNIGIESVLPKKRLKGTLYEKPEDFIVNEIHEGFSCSTKKENHEATFLEGNYIYSTLVKRNISTFEACGAFCKENGLDYFRDMSFCGLKDTLGVTSQLVCIKNKQDLKIKNTTFDDFFLKDFAASEKKLEIGTHCGNAFIIKVGNISGSAKDIREAKDTFRILMQNGFPNFYGPQRFGIRQNNHFLGKLLLKKEYEKFLYDFLTFSKNESDHVFSMREKIKHNFGSWDKCLEILCSAKELSEEISLIKNLSQGDSVINAIKKMKTSEFFVHSYSSYLFNVALSRLLTNGWVNMKLEKIGKGSEMDETSSKAYERIMEKEDIRIDDFNESEFDAKAHKRNTLFYAKDFSLELDDNNAIIKFSLGKGEYASLVLCFLIDSDIRKLC